ncbi:MAG: DUF1211 domain-containing protein [Proteobacteria bacterium]|nr:DUF1211 domain-containing protein [Pseudomonadota bacterium]
MSVERQATPAGPASPDATPLPKGRLEALTDGIFAVSMTLLVLDLKLPEHVAFTDDIGTNLAELLPRFDHYVISFVVLCLFWLSHLRMMRRLREVDGPFMALNLAFLLFTTFVPAFTAFVGNNPGHPRPAILYGLNLALILCCEALMWRRTLLKLANDSIAEPQVAWHAVRNRLAVALGIVVAGMTIPILQAHHGIQGHYGAYVYVLLLAVGVVQPKLHRAPVPADSAR